MHIIAVKRVHYFFIFLRKRQFETKFILLNLLRYTIFRFGLMPLKRR